MFVLPLIGSNLIANLTLMKLAVTLFLFYIDSLSIIKQRYSFDCESHQVDVVNDSMTQKNVPDNEAKQC